MTTGAGPFTARLGLLEESGQVTREARQLTEAIVVRIERDFTLQFDEENGAQFVTHLAMAFSRLQRHEGVTEGPGVVEDEIESCEREAESVRSIVDDCQRELGIAVPPAEVSYMVIHLCAMTQGEVL